ncbi:Tubulin-like protein [Rubripirellula obstinata]|uniref:Tubulin-like protein n=1 Tax=Rubripirellula obstinata TaxID=406547 RepID=A0A5B1CE22_9BACT|nr:tubulin-like doman-containing protein [Rubripirellula obstinata]KAA1257840.1 Tubulin-like protein [Rubripirellula obstinata]
MTTLQAPKIQAGYEPLPGYRLEKRIGQGGFGEVWRAGSPGGMKKAIKFVFGSHDQSRATREMRSLERIKGVRHPFLLTLERFEIIDDQLVIVTELADESLEDVQARYRKNGSCGIPREKLLSYLNDSADALDYLHDSYKLQHLDIKPGNLLMVGGHVKVADFGLLKDLRDVECSVVGGLTPVYAPPELFDGRPSIHSDQYSLAVMYQELLTGTRPFSGRTIAQLASQHVHSPPNLEPLPPSDRPVLAKAFEKTPERRFPSCREFVEALRDARKRPVSVASSTDTPIFGQQEAKADVADLPLLADGGGLLPEKAKTESATKHALVIAIGGSGAECVRELRRRVADPRMSSGLKLHSVLIDTDMRTIHSMRLAEASDRVPKCNLIHTPLKTAHQYRENGTEKLRSISRRWIYNVPRSGATEGMRPLGRLALVDHGEMVTKKLSESIHQLIEEVGQESVDVYVVGSLAGGTCSGMYIDVVHLLRDLMDKSGLADTKILSLLTSAPLLVDQRNPIAAHDTQAALVEIEHFLKAGNGYPGDEGAGWPSVPAARTPLHDIYLVAGASNSRFGISPVDTIVEYLWADVNECDELFEQARSPAKQEKGTVSKLGFRSVGVVPLGDSHRLEQGLLAPALVREVMMAWIGNPATASNRASFVVQRLMRRIGLSPDAITAQIQNFLTEKQITTDAAVESKGSSQDSDAGVAKPDPVTLQIEALANGGRFDWMCAGWINNLYREISVGLSDRRVDLVTAVESLKLIKDQAAKMKAHAFDSLTDLPNTSGNSRPQSKSDRDFVCRTVRAVTAVQFDHLSRSIKFLEERLERFSTILAIAINESKQNSREENPWASMPDEIKAYLPELKNCLHDAAVNSYLVRPLNDQSSNVDARYLITELSRQATDLVIPVVQQHNNLLVVELGKEMKHDSVQSDGTKAFNTAKMVQHSIDATQTMPDSGQRLTDSPVTIEEALELARPELLSLGGMQRLVLVVSNEIERGRMESELRAIYDGAVTVAVIPGAAPKLVHEAQQIELKNVLSRLSALNGGNEHVTARLSSRTDVAW